MGRAKEVLAKLETGHRMVPGAPPRDPDPLQPTLFDPSPEPLKTPTTTAESHPISDRLRSLDPNQMTPLEALQELARLKGEVGQ